MRYFGPHPLTEDNVQVAGSSLLWSGRAAYEFDKDAHITLDVLNLFDRRVNDIEYFYTSQLRNEATPQPDRHFHPAEPRTVRLSLITRF